MSISIGEGITFGPGISISVGPPMITATAGNTSPLSVQQNTAITSFNAFESVIDGTAPYTYFVSAGVLPTGIVIASGNGVVSGTSNVVQSAANVTFSVKDVNNVVAITTTTRSFEITVIPISATAGATTTVLAQLGNSMTSFNAFSSVNNGTVPYTYYTSLGTLPSGITINENTGVVLGLPTITQSAANVTFSVRDVNNVVASTTSTVSFTVNAALSAVAGNTTSVLGEETLTISSFNAFTSVNGGYTPYVYGIVSGTLPTGINLNTSTGLVSGTPTVAYPTANVVFKVTDATGVIAATTTTVNFVIANRISATAGTTTAVSVQRNTAITSFTPFASVSGVYTPYTYFVSSGTLPTGITINPSTGLVSGTPTTVQSLSNVVFSVRDNLNVSAVTTVTVSFTVTAPPPYTVDYLIVGGGGSGGGSPGGGGGGAGAFVPGSLSVTPSTSYPITVGTGGIQVFGSAGNKGTASQFNGISAPGGGGGANTPSTPTAITAGASGGGGSSPNGPGGPATGSPGPGQQGTFGYPGSPAIPTGTASAGGGGAGGTGTSGSGPAGSSFGGTGGARVTWPFTGPTVFYAGGGGGWGVNPGPGAGPGGGPFTGGGSPSTIKGGGGGGTNQPQGSGAGGAGVVILAVPTPNYPGSAPGAAVSTPPSAPGKTVLTYTNPGSYTA